MKIKKILQYLEKHQGKTLSEREILKLFEKTKKKKKSQKELIEPEVIISELVNLSLIEIKNKKYTIKSPFLVECKISFSPTGLVFAMPRFLLMPNEFPKDIFVPPNRSKGVLIGDIALVRLVDKKRERFEGEVISIVKRNRKFFRMEIQEFFDTFAIGLLLDIPGKLLAAVDLKGLSKDTKERIHVKTKIIVKLTGKMITLRQSRFFEGAMIRFEDETEFDVDFDRILIKYNLNPYYPHFEIPNYDPEKPETIPDWNSRKDLRDLYTITIDGEDAKDFDDAVSLEIPSKNKYKLYVHIADVSLYVEKDSPLDKEALGRGTSYYLANRVIPMLPPVLSENLCSLVEGKNRLTVTVEMDIDARTGKIQKAKFYRSIIRVNKRYTYEAAENLIDTNIDPILPDLWKLAQVQRNDRIKKGRIDLEIPEPKFIFGENDKVIEIQTRKRLRSSMIIEECMLSANIAVAEYLYKKKTPTLYRVHEPMDEEKLELLNAFFEIYDIKVNLDDVDSFSIQKAIEKVQKKGEKESRIFNLILLRSFMQARYSPESIGHWGLGFKHYCHFTSPIRRYPDLVVHRALISTLKRKKSPYEEEEMWDLAIKTSEAERQAMEAERDIWKLKLIRYIETTNQSIFHGFITGIRNEGVYLELEECPVDGFVPAKYLTNEPELIFPDPFSVYVKKLSRPAFLGERWKLELERVDPENLKIYFKPLF
ncbi:MAG: VacB/RNase II family 3'-5' exoribonuclease [Leptospiraceae bacterium]|nr:VacB/RNase II family 3'-5' exoribonuclease [Leptospiraceae bacterium]MDW7977131.1 VacB/RNase II family 3'-5' exoribonuclease [Leptospiraceae bacterium]